MKRADATFWARSHDVEPVYRKIAALAAQNGAHRLVLYGSRARGDNRYNSDIDIAVYGMSERQFFVFREAVDELPTLLEFDIVQMGDKLTKLLVENIERDGVELMNKVQEKKARFAEAVDRLKEALEDYKTTPLTSVRDGCIQRFEFCTELAWKSIREYLIDQGFTEINSPKATLRKAYAAGVITDEQGWSELIDDRNMTSHVYSEETAVSIFGRIESRYLPLFEQALEYLSE